MTGEFQEGDILLTNPVKDSDSAGFCSGDPNDVPAGPAKIALQWLNALNRRPEVLFKELPQDIHR
jgi:hypothetical protein